MKIYGWHLTILKDSIVSMLAKTHLFGLLLVDQKNMQFCS